MESICLFGFHGKEGGDVRNILTKPVLGDLVDKFEEKCPLLHTSCK